jgi:hypothetical protein
MVQGGLLRLAKQGLYPEASAFAKISADWLA